ncbi:hypothetical protein [Blastococcus deserti]|uniref:DivIVA domain-containing protein n=1 Tax=Blastococcus deserti TaxID=2259033 RepID=A0ABW4XDE1_9ACTN
MGLEPHVDDRTGGPATAPGPLVATGPRNRRRPNVSGDLPTVLQAGPMFRRVPAGYDRFQVDTYVQWAEDELATADREHEDLLARHLDTRAALEEARELLSHSTSGGEFLQLSRRIGSMLARAADEAESMRADAEADRAAATAQAAEAAACAARALADAEAEARRMVAEAATRVEDMTATAARIVADAERTSADVRAEAEAALAEARAVEQRAEEHADRIRQQAGQDAAAARLRARDEVVRMLATGRDERRRADAEAAAARERLDQEAAGRRTVLLAEVAQLERRRAALAAELHRPAAPVTTSSDALRLHRRRHLGWIQDHLRSHPGGWGSAPRPSVAAPDASTGA